GVALGSVPFFAVLLFVFRLRHVLVALHDACGRAGLLERHAAGVFGAHGAVREQALERAALAGRARRHIARADQLLELVAAAAAAILVNRHTRDGTRMARAAQPAGL